jgi:hypothetical protein
MRRHPNETSEYRREVRLRLEADTKRYILKSLFRILKKRLGAFYAPPQ